MELKKKLPSFKIIGPERKLIYSNASLEAQLDVNLRCGRLKTNSPNSAERDPFRGH